MTDSMNKELVKQVQSSLTKHINKPQLTEKLLNKPPFKFLHDIVTNVIKNTGYLSGVFTDEEIISTNVTSKETKIKFLEKLIAAIQSTTSKTVSARPSKIVAGLEVAKTLEMLMMIVFGIETKIKEQNSTNTKTKKLEVTKNSNHNKTKVLEKPKSQEKKIKENTDHDSQKNVQKITREDSTVVKNNEPINMKMDTTKNSDVKLTVNPVNEDIQNTVNNSFKPEEQNEKMQSTIKSSSEKQNTESTEKNCKEENQLRKLSDVHNISKPLRPKSSRPPAPNRRPQSNTYTEIPKHSDSFFAKNDNNISDIDDNIVSIEVINNNKSSYDPSYAQGDGHGHLVSQILQTQLEFNIKKKTDSLKTEWEGKNIKDQEMLTKEMDTIRQFIQDITKSANPLSKLINNVQENVDQMNRELNYWKNFTEKMNEKLIFQQRIADEQIKPMVILLEKLKIDIKDELEMIDYCKANIMKNKDHINYLVAERFTPKK